ncbi:HAD family phosphatase [Membranicola marinus]|uniref:HAD family phosphatase n=1 Tax=Membranihabitans marinus TaxID=1227546 RepID=A0A953L9I8_9BACT|nr:HAD family phosphatase [Membranihabitans marinus]MBY5956696.1 HAD family phosphatase [Membranihabitans marinus]
MEKKLSTIIFDFGNVLIDLDIPGFRQRMSNLTGIQPADQSHKIREVMASYECGLLSTELFINRIIKLSARPVQALDIIQCWNSMLVGIKPETLKILRHFKSHFDTYLLSNTNALHIEWVHRHLKDEHNITAFETEYLHGSFYSHELKMAKPDPQIYQEVQRRIEVPGEQILFIDDLEENVAGAKNAGWHSVVHPPGHSIADTLNSFQHLSHTNYVG